MKCKSPLWIRRRFTQMLISLVHELTKLPLASTPKHMTMVLCPLLEPIVGFLFSHILMGKFVKVLVDVVSSVLNIVLLNPTLNAMLYKKTLAMRVVGWKSYHKKWLLAFLLHIMMVGGIASKVIFESHIDFGFVMMILIIMWEASKWSMRLIDPLCL